MTLAALVVVTRRVRHSSYQAEPIRMSVEPSYWVLGVPVPGYPALPA